MPALAAPRNTPQSLGSERSFPLPAGGKIFQGGMVAVNVAGWAVSANATVANMTMGRAEETVDNTAGANGDRRIKVAVGIFLYNNSAAADLITRTEIGSSCYVVDDQTVAKGNGGGTRPIAGTVYDVTSQGVWVRFR